MESQSAVLQSPMEKPAISSMPCAAGELPVAHPRRQSFDEARDAFFAVGRDELAKRCPQSGMGEGRALDPRKNGFGVGFGDIGKRDELLLGDGVVQGSRWARMRHAPKNS
ncbi:hypothetical protein MCBRY_001290 [Methylocystis bryophila]